MMKLKTAAVAGSFYPDNTAELNQTVTQLLTDNPCAGSKPKALVIPHAGFRYSGAIAALAYNRIRPYLDQYQRVIILGPAHKVAFDFLAAIDADAWRTPLGDIKLDKEYTDKLVTKGLAHYFNKAHGQEHSLEVHLPFLQKIGLANIPVIPIVVGAANIDSCSTTISHILNNDENLLIISSDLSHFHPYEQAISIDSMTNKAILKMQHDIQPQQACGCYPLNGFLKFAQKNHYQSELLGYCTSGDIGASKKSVVGYAAFSFTSESNKTTSDEKNSSVNQTSFSIIQQQHMLNLARQSIQSAFTNTQLNTTFDNAYLNQPLACFVTLKSANTSTEVSNNKQSLKLRGCIGNLQVRGSLGKSICRNAKLAAFQDHRFTPVLEEEIKNIVIEISILSSAQKIEVSSEQELIEKLRTGVDGLILNHHQRQATFLPSVWEQISSPQQFINQLKLKAGMAADFWADDMQCYIYQSFKFSE